MNMREIMRLITEAAAYGSKTFWINPKTNEMIPADDHGETVARQPERFDIPWDVVSELEDAMPYGFEEHETDRLEEPLDLNSLPPLPEELWGGHQGWSRNDAWEVLAMNRGWVRVGLGSNVSAAYLSGVSEAVVWKACKALASDLPGRVEIEICRPENPIFKTLNPEDLETFLSRGPRSLAALGH